MKPRMFNRAAVAVSALCAISFSLAIAMIALWVWSYFSACSFGYYAAKDQQGWYRDYYLFSYRGSVSYTWFRQGSKNSYQRDAFRFSVSNWNAPDRFPWLWAHRDDVV